MNTTITNLINDFAKNNRIGKARVEELASKIIENCAPVKTVSKKQKKEKTPSKRVQQSTFIRNEIINRANRFEVFSLNQVAGDLGVSRYLVKEIVENLQKENVIKPTAPEKISSKGRPSVLWMLA